ncbi:MAG: hypothetical protein CVV42_09420 [Candidatus Riflebacteria bacterium HGW-Riflebacteria-2]|jgi:Flp pilus assembly pilin Flp|nr:MAG: hypothetical protein CVV42_09420 [Candidatus Riflebacteria bacterium HGW-Riflebacteria-2]
MHYKKKNRRGQGLVEYALLIGLIAVSGIAAMTYFSSTFNGSLIAKINQVLSNATDYISEGLGTSGGDAPPTPEAAPTPDDGSADSQ